MSSGHKHIAYNYQNLFNNLRADVANGWDYYGQVLRNTSYFLPVSPQLQLAALNVIIDLRKPFRKHDYDLKFTEPDPGISAIPGATMSL